MNFSVVFFVYFLWSGLSTKLDNNSFNATTVASHGTKLSVHWLFKLIRGSILWQRRHCQRQILKGVNMDVFRSARPFWHTPNLMKRRDLHEKRCRHIDSGVFTVLFSLRLISSLVLKQTETILTVTDFFLIFKAFFRSSQFQFALPIVFNSYSTVVSVRQPFKPAVLMIISEFSDFLVCLLIFCFDMNWIRKMPQKMLVMRVFTWRWVWTECVPNRSFCFSCVITKLAKLATIRSWCRRV